MKVVLIEDNPDTSEAIRLAVELGMSGVQITSSYRGLEGLELVEKESPDIVILDIGLPDIDGFEVLKRLRLFSDVAVIILTVRGEEMERVKGLELGADDYVVKPFSPIELMARVRAVLRRTAAIQMPGAETPYTSKRLNVDFAARQVTVAGKEVRLTPTEYNLLYHLIRNAGKVMLHQTLLEKVWGTEYTDAAEYLKVYIQRLREKLEENPSNPQMIFTERGVGYRFVKTIS